MHNLLLITSEFPYLSGEPFLSNELPYLSKSFNEIYIFSINGKVTDRPTREIPLNAKSFPLGNTTSKLKYFRYMIAGIKKPDKDLQIRENKLKKVAVSLYTRGRASEIANSILNIIDSNRLLVNGSTIYSFWFSYQAVAAWLLSKILNKSGNNSICISRAHGYDLYWERTAGGYLPFQDASLRNLNGCFPCSEFGTQYLVEKYPWASKKVKTERLGTREFGLNPYKGEKTLVTCCNLEPLKRMSLFAEAFCEVAKIDKHVKWICIGSGEEEGIINKIISSAGIEKQVIMTGRLNNQEVMNIYQNIGIMYFCNVSTTEGLPVSIMEAMSFGIPILATDVGGTSELVNEDNGYILEANICAKKLAQHMHIMLSVNETAYRLMRESSRSKWKKMASAEVNYTDFCKLILSLQP